MQDPKVEKLLDDMFIDYVYVPDVPIEDFDVDASLKNQARIDPPLYPETVSSYTAALKDGAEFPALVGYYSTNKSVVLTDGNHRLAAHIAHGVQTMDCYIVDAAPELLQALTYMGNSMHGRPPTEEERIKHAIHLKDLQYTNEEAARIVQLSVNKIHREWSFEQMIRRARKLGKVKLFERLPKDCREKLQPIKNDDVWCKAVDFLGNNIRSLSRPEYLSFLQKVKAQTTERTQLKAIEEFRQELIEANRSDGGKAKHRQDARRGIVMHLAYIHKAEPEAVANATLTDEQRENLEDHLIRAVTTCNQIMKLLREDVDD